MFYQIVSDLHLEWHRDQGRGFIESLPRAAPNIILAGDICAYPQIMKTMERFAAKWDNVVYVAGNHEFYGTDFNTLFKIQHRVLQTFGNVYWLERGHAEIPGAEHKVHGATLWFDEHPTEPRVVNDFRQIARFEPAVYDRHRATRKYLRDNVCSGDVVVTHHTPSYQSQSERFAALAGGCWFHNNMDSLIYEAKPRLWVHGHTHDSFDYTIDETRIICNPFGYVGYDMNPNFKEELVVEI